MRFSSLEDYRCNGIPNDGENIVLEFLPNYFVLYRNNFRIETKQNVFLIHSKEVHMCALRYLD